MNGDCIFCAVIARTVPASFVYEDDVAVAFLDLFPVHRGHTLVVPRTHASDLLSCPSDVVAHLLCVCADVAPALVTATGADAFNVWTANGRAAGQQVFHLHLHILPRFKNDKFGLRFPKDYPKQADRGELDATAAAIRSKL